MPADKPFLAGAGESRWITWQVLLGCDGGYLSMFDFVFLPGVLLPAQECQRSCLREHGQALQLEHVKNRCLVLCGTFTAIHLTELQIFFWPQTHFLFQQSKCSERLSNNHLFIVQLIEI